MRQFRPAFLWVIACLLALGPAGAGRAIGAEPTLAEAASAYGKGEHLRAQRLLKPLALRGDAAAQHLLAIMYAEGQGVPKDAEEALRWLRLSAEKGFAPSQYNLGVRYADGLDVEQDDGQAVAWFRRAADQGHAEAAYNLGVMYASGRGLAQDFTEAANWYERAARQGVADAQYNLGFSYANGFGVPRDPAKAYAWLSAAARGFGKMDPEGRSLALDAREEVARLLSPDDQLAAAQAAATLDPAATIQSAEDPGRRLHM